jgi:hypothetical protein
MNEEYVYTYGDIIVSPYKFEKINKFRLVQEINEHARFYISGILSEESTDEYVETASENQTISVALTNADQSIEPFFNGIVTNISISVKNNVRTLEIEALSYTYLMDTLKCSATFQNEQFTYTNVFNKINSKYGSYSMVNNVTGSIKVNQLLVQYRETDWEFLKRLASHFNVGLVPACSLSGIKYSIGWAGGGKGGNLTEFNYSIKKGLLEYKLKAYNEGYSLSDLDLISYEITTNKIMNLYDDVAFNGRKLMVYQCDIQMIKGALVNKCILRDEIGMKVEKLYNDGIVGVSLQGRVLDVQKDEVKVSLELDGSPTESEGAKWFKYATVFSSPYGTGWYCMPEVEDVVRLYFPDNVENHAYVLNSLHYPYSDSDQSKRSDPDVKSFSTKYGKEIIMRPGGIDIISGSNLMTLDDNGGIQVKSDNDISMSGSSVSISGGSVSIYGDGGVTLSQSGASIKIKDDVVMSGGKINTQ